MFGHIIFYDKRENAFRTLINVPRAKNINIYCYLLLLDVPQWASKIYRKIVIFFMRYTKMRLENLKKCRHRPEIHKGKIKVVAQNEK